MKIHHLVVGCGLLVIAWGIALWLSSGNPVGDTEPQFGDSSVAPGQVIVFEDPNLEAAVREVIGKPSGTLLLGDVTGLTVLDASDWNIHSLEGMEHLMNLKKLYLAYNAVVDITPLAGLTNLEDLHLYSNPIEDIRPLAGLTNLEILDLRGNPGCQRPPSYTGEWYGC